MAQQLGVSTVLPNDQSQLSSTRVEWLTAPGLAFGLKFLNYPYSLMMGPVVISLLVAENTGNVLKEDRTSSKSFRNSVR